MSDLEQTLAGKAGLFFRVDRLTDSGWQQEQSARQSLERWCAYCGQSSCYGFGETLTTAGVLTCSDPSCIASAEAEIASKDRVQSAREVSSEAPPAKPHTPVTDTLDLFGEAA
ncbi:hypothetical protein [Methylobacterium sp. WL7]|uniref:hypothetical protein n=1 Tax=Methylobacterium sp. WL7 TaxID=2603900 RepID=UPI0011C92286|nr:hypothetical protein [Methylobacterium sp. WL7]TXN40063.1 hypothetical protein FV233_27170 [Methylobacterium sp. WL7]